MNDDDMDIPVDELGYLALLEEANNTDLIDMERCQCIQIRHSTTENIPMLLFLPKLAINANSHEKIDILFHKMLLLFIKLCYDLVKQGDYILIYGHVPALSLLSQQSLIYKYYKLLPRPYKKNLKQFIIIQPQLAIKVIFEFTKVFISQKFYSKLKLINTLHELQLLISPYDLLLPNKLLRYDDEDSDINKIITILPTLVNTYIPMIGMTQLLYDCIHYLKTQGGLERVGIFRIPGDENVLNLAKIRLQHIYCDKSNEPLIFDKIIIGKSKNINITDNNPLNSNETSNQTSISNMNSNSNSASNSSKNTTMNGSKVASFSLTGSTVNNKGPIPAIAIFTDIDTVAQILKYSLRELPEPVITFDAFDELIKITKQYKSVSFRFVAMVLSHSFISIISFQFAFVSFSFIHFLCFIIFNS